MESQQIGVRIETALTYSSLLDLVRGNILCVRVPNFYAPAIAEQIGELLERRVAVEGTSRGKIYLSDIDAFFNTIEDQEARGRYLNSSVSAMVRLRRLCEPHIFPGDSLRLVLDEVWTGGAGLMRIDSRPMFFGITRIWNPGSEALPHQDCLARELPDDPLASKLISQIGANVYLRTSKSGGELDMWDQSFTLDECRRMGIKGSYGFDRSFLHQGHVSVAPEVGDLILINTMKVHAVRKIVDGQRLTVSGFVGFWGEREPLRFWS